MPDDNKPATPTGESQQPDISAIVNSAVTSQLKRVDFGKMITDGIERALAQRAEQQQSAQPKTPEQPSANGAAAVNPDVAKLTAELAKMREQNERAERRRQEIEQQARTDKAHADIRARLQAANVRPELLEAAHVLLTNKALRFDKETGDPSLSIKRTRAAGASAEAQDFDIEGGVKDWLASTEAKPFLPAPTKPPAPITRPRGPNDPPPRAAKTHEEMLDNALDRLGPDGTEALRRAFAGA